MDLLAMALAKKAANEAAAKSVEQAAEKTLENKKVEVPSQEVEVEVVEEEIPPFDPSLFLDEAQAGMTGASGGDELEGEVEADIPPFVPPVEVATQTSVAPVGNSLLALLGQSQPTSPQQASPSPTPSPQLPTPKISANILAATTLLKERMAEEGTKIPLFVPSTERTGIIPDGFQFILDQLADQQEGYGTWLIQMHKQLAEDPALLHMLSDADRRLMYVRALDETRKQTATVTKKASAKSEKKVKEIANEQIVLDAFKDF